MDNIRVKDMIRVIKKLEGSKKQSNDAFKVILMNFYKHWRACIPGGQILSNIQLNVCSYLIKIKPFYRRLNKYIGFHKPYHF